MPRMAASTAAASRMSPLTNSMSRSTSRSRRKAPRELSSNTRTASPSPTSALTSAEPRKPLPPVTRMRRALIRPPVLRLLPPAVTTSRARTGNRYQTRTNARKCARLLPGRPLVTSTRSRPPREDFIMSVASYRLAAIGLACALVTPASAQLLARKDVSAAMALTIAQTAIATCTANGYRVSATVVGRNGEVLVQIRGDGTGPHTMENSFKKAFTSRTFRIPSGEMEERLKQNPQMGAQFLTGFTTARGALPIKVGDEVIGGAGVSGAPGGEKDEACVKAALDKVADQLK